MGIWAKIRRGLLVAAMVATGSLYAQTTPDGIVSSQAEESLIKKSSLLVIEAKAGERPALARGKGGAGLSTASLPTLAAAASTKPGKPRRHSTTSARPKTAAKPRKNYDSAAAQRSLAQTVPPFSSEAVYPHKVPAARPGSRESSLVGTKNLCKINPKPERMLSDYSLLPGNSSSLVCGVITAQTVAIQPAAALYRTDRGPPHRSSIPPTALTEPGQTATRGGISRLATVTCCLSSQESRNFGHPTPRGDMVVCNSQINAAGSQTPPPAPQSSATRVHNRMPRHQSTLPFSIIAGSVTTGTVDLSDNQLAQPAVFDLSHPSPLHFLRSTHYFSLV